MDKKLKNPFNVISIKLNNSVLLYMQDNNRKVLWQKNVLKRGGVVDTFPYCAIFSCFLEVDIMKSQSKIRNFLSTFR